MEQIVFKQSGTTRMTTTRTFDYLNRLKSIGSVNASSVVLDSHSYAYNNANQRTAVTNADSSRWAYQYDALGQVTSGKKYWSDNGVVPGEQFGYTFDDIGNRTTTTAGGDQYGGSLRAATYGANSLNQYTNRTVPSAIDVLGSAVSNATVTVNLQPAYRHGDFYRAEVPITNASTAAWQSISNVAVINNGTNADTVGMTSGNVFLPKTPEAFTYDDDGNLKTDGRWTYTWDGENRLVKMTCLTNIPTTAKLRLTFDYDWQGRRIMKSTENFNGASWSTTLSNRFVYDGWNLSAELNATNNGPIRTYAWGLDLSGSLQGAGGVGGLILVSLRSGTATNSFASYDGNGDLYAMVDTATGQLNAEYQYGPFGEVIRATGPGAKANPFRFSTKYQDDESDLVYYGCRYLKTSSGGWLSKDPLDELGFRLLQTGEAVGDDDIDPHMEGNPYRFVKNDPISRNDAFGLWPSASPWYGRVLNGGFAIPLTHENSDARVLTSSLAAGEVGIVDAASVFVDNGQGTADSYQHAMRAPGQSKAAAKAKANAWVTQNLTAAQNNWCTCGAMNRPVALWFFGMALHTVQDSTSPAHHGFQVWHGVSANPITWLEAEHHVAKEAWDPGAGSNLDKATAWLWSFMKCPPPRLPADFFIFKEDWNWWYD